MSLNDMSRIPDRYRLPQEDRRLFYEKPEWWLAAVKNVLAAIVVAAVLGVGGTFLRKHFAARRHSIESAAQEERLAEIDASRARAEKEQAEQAARAAREKTAAEEKAARDLRDAEARAAREEAEKAEAEARAAEAAREKAPRHFADLVRALGTSSVRWWGDNPPEAFANRASDAPCWYVFPAGDAPTLVRVKPGETNGAPETIEIAEGDRFRPFVAELFARDVAAQPHLVMTGSNAWIRLPSGQEEKAAHFSVPDPFSLRAGEVLAGTNLFALVKGKLHGGNRLDGLRVTLEFHWREERQPPLKWELGFAESITRTKFAHAVQKVLQDEMDAAAATEDAARADAGDAPAPRAEDRPSAPPAQLRGGARATRRLGEGSNELAGGPQGRNVRRLGDNYRTLAGGPQGRNVRRLGEDADAPDGDGTPRASGAGKEKEPKERKPPRARADKFAYERATAEGYLSVRRAE